MKRLLTIGGGCSGSTIRRLISKPLPEFAEWNDCMQIRKRIQFDEPPIVHFAEGHHTQFLKTFNGGLSYLINSLYRQYYAKSPKHKHYIKPNYITLKPTQTQSIQPSNLDAISKTFQHLAKVSTPNDHLTIFLSSHGTRHGIVLWNQYFTTEFLSVKQLGQYLKPIQGQIQLIVESCYSGQFLELTNEHIYVFTSSNQYKPSQYSTNSTNWPSRIRWSSNLLPDFLNLPSKVNHNYRATQSLDWYLTQQINQLMDTRLQIITRPIIHQWLQFIDHPRVLPIKPYLIIGLILLDSTTLMAKYIIFKPLLAISKMLASIIKCGGVFYIAQNYILKLGYQLCPKLYLKLESLYCRRFVWRSMRKLDRFYHQYLIDHSLYLIDSKHQQIITQLTPQPATSTIPTNHLTHIKLTYYLQYCYIQHQQIPKELSAILQQINNFSSN